MRRKSFRPSRQGAQCRRQHVLRDTGLFLAQIGAAFKIAARPDPPRFLLRPLVTLAAGLRQMFLQFVAPLAGQLIRLLARDALEFQQVIQIACQHCLAFANRAVKHGLGKGRLIGLVVP